MRVFFHIAQMVSHQLTLSKVRLEDNENILRYENVKASSSILTHFRNTEKRNACNELVTEGGRVSSSYE
jgi:hypothetical protein